MPLKVCFRNDKLRSQSFKDTCDIKFSACEVIFRGGGVRVLVPDLNLNA